MGAYSPSRLMSNELENKVIKKIIQPTLKALLDLNTKYKGFLYAGLMIVNDEPFLIEYNVRMGDPECQTILPKLKTDLLEIFLACCNKSLSKTNIEWQNKKSMCVVLCSKGYPEKFKKNIEIKNLDKIQLDENNFLFHAGTINKNDKVFSSGGRVLNFVSISDTFEDTKKKVYSRLDELNWTDGFCRRDIGNKVTN